MIYKELIRAYNTVRFNILDAQDKLGIQYKGLQSYERANLHKKGYVLLDDICTIFQLDINTLTIFDMLEDSGYFKDSYPKKKYIGADSLFIIYCYEPIVKNNGDVFNLTRIAVTPLGVEVIHNLLLNKAVQNG